MPRHLTCCAVLVLGCGLGAGAVPAQEWSEPARGSATRSALMDALHRSKPAGAKGTYVKRVSLSSTMGPGVKVDTTTINAQA